MRKLIGLTCVVFSLFAQEIEYSASGGMTEERFAGFKEKYNCNTFIETGTLVGYTTRKAAPYFKDIFTVELHPVQYKIAKENLKNFENIKVIEGRSEIEIEKILEERGAASTLVFLDAHYAGGGTTKAKNDPPVNEEFCAMQPYVKNDTVIILDDIRCFYSNFTMLERGYYPYIRDIKNYVEKNFEGFGFYIIGDQALIYNPKYFNDEISAGVHLLTNMYVAKTEKDFIFFARSLAEELSEQEKKAVGLMAENITACAMMSLVHAIIEKSEGHEKQASKYFNLACEQGIKKSIIEKLR